jgi:(heptosyl)LPS beta-1,4-glucosyltransferase
VKTISAVINTMNEEENLPLALRSVCPWVDEVVVVDMYSRDRTVELAREFGARVILHPGPGFLYPPRAYAIEQATCDWILFLDADELVPVALSKELRTIAETDDSDVVLLPRTNYLLGSPMHFTGWGARQDLQVRFFRKGFVEASSQAHHDFTPLRHARTKALPFRGENALVHFNYIDVSQFIDKLNRYTSIEALQMSQSPGSLGIARSLGVAIREFLVRYVKNRGFLDGWRGLYLSLCMAFYRIVIGAKCRELQIVGSREDVKALYRREAECVLEGYETSSVNQAVR